MKRKQIPWYEWVYEVSDQWQIRSVDRYITQKWQFKNPLTNEIKNERKQLYKWKVLSQSKWHKGHLSVHLHKQGKAKRYSVSRLVYGVFNWMWKKRLNKSKNTTYDDYVTHIDGDLSNNNLENLCLWYRGREKEAKKVINICNNEKVDVAELAYRWSTKQWEFTDQLKQKAIVSRILDYIHEQDKTARDCSLQEFFEWVQKKNNC